MQPVSCGLVPAFPVDYLGVISVLWKLLWVWQSSSTLVDDFLQHHCDRLVIDSKVLGQPPVLDLQLVLLASVHYVLEKPSRAEDPVVARPLVRQKTIENADQRGLLQSSSRGLENALPHPLRLRR